MHPFAITGVLCVLIWLGILFARGHFWMVQRFAAEVAPVVETGLIAVVIPARNEAEVIGAAVKSLMQQTYAGGMHVFLVDDSSCDGTANVAREAAATSARADALTVINGRPLPAGWSGKVWAVQQGIEQALCLQPAFLLLTDADIQHSPKNVATLVAIAERGDYDLASFMVKLHCRGVAERLLIPAFVFFFFLLYPPEWIRDPERKTAGAAGGCILIRPTALTRAGGIAAIRNQIIDDCALASAVKRSGGKIWLGVTQTSHSLRAYGSFSEIELMVARTAFNQLRHSAWLLTATIAGLLFTYLLPVGLLFSRTRAHAALGATAYLLMTVAYMPMVRFYELNVLWALTLPISAVFYAGATLRSALKYWSGSGGDWKGRAQDLVNRRQS